MKKYVSFLEAMEEYINNDNDVKFHGKNGEVEILFDAAMSMRGLGEMEEIKKYTLFDLTDGKWSIVE